MASKRKSFAAKRVRAKARAELLLAEIRQSVGLTQAELAARLGIQQPTLSKLESQNDIQVSTLRRLIRALGGELELIAQLPVGDIRIGQFSAR